MKCVGKLSVVMAIAVLLPMLAACGARPGQSATAAPTAVGAAAVPTVAVVAGPTAAAPAATPTAAPTIVPSRAAQAPASPPTAIAAAQPSVAPAAGQDDAGSGADAADTVSEALEVRLNVEHRGILGEDDEEDWYAFLGDDGAILEVAFRAERASDGLSVYLLDTERNVLAERYRITPGKEVALRYVLSASTGGSFHLQVTGEGAYAFLISGDLQTDASGVGDAGDTLNEAVEFGADKVIEGLLGDADEQDWYVVPLGHGAIVEIAFTPDRTAGRLSIYLYNPAQHEIWYAYGVAGGLTKTGRYLIDAASGGDHYLQVTGGAGAYTVDFKAGQQNDAGLGVDAPQYEDALGILPNAPLNGELGDADEQDWYHFQPAKGMEIRFTPAKGSEGLSLFLLDGNRDVIWEEYRVLANRTVRFTLEEVTAGNYAIQVVGGSGGYTFEVTK